MAQGFPVIIQQRQADADFAPSSGWKIYTYVADGTFTTPLTTYSTATLSATNTNPIITDASGVYNAFVAQDVQLDVQVTNAADVLQYTRLSLEPMSSGFDAATSYNRTGATDTNGTYSGATITGATISTSTLASPTITGNTIGGVVVAKSVTFAETATGVSHVATIPIPAGATLLDILVSAGVLWGAAAAVLKVGDTADDDGYFTGVDLKATDFLVGEVLSVSGSTANWGGQEGAYLVAATGRRGPAATNFGAFYAAGSNILATITVTTPSVTTGRTYLTVFYATGQAVAPVVT